MGSGMMTSVPIDRLKTWLTANGVVYREGETYPMLLRKVQQTAGGIPAVLNDIAGGMRDPLNNPPMEIGTVTTGPSTDPASATVDSNNRLSLVIPAGPTGADGKDGAAGADGATGATGATGPIGQGIAAGGTTGQALVKVDGTDYNTQWSDVLTLAGVTGADPLALTGQLTMAGNKHIQLTEYTEGADPTLSDDTKVLLSATTSGTNSAQLLITTDDGYLKIGPRNGSFCHLYTDRSYFYFNKPISFDGGGALMAYNDDLQIQTDDTSGNPVTRIFASGGTADCRVGIGAFVVTSDEPATELEVKGTIRQSAVTSAPIYADSNGDLGALTIGASLSLTGSTLTDAETVVIASAAPIAVANQTVVYCDPAAVGGTIDPPTFIHRKGINATNAGAPVVFDGTAGNVMIIGNSAPHGGALFGTVLTLSPGTSLTVMAMPVSTVPAPPADAAACWLITGTDGIGAYTIA